MNGDEITLVCPDCKRECPDAIRYDKESRFNSWACECGCGLTCLGNSPDEARNTWRHMIFKKLDKGMC